MYYLPAIEVNSKNNWYRQNFRSLTETKMASVLFTCWHELQQLYYKSSRKQFNRLEIAQGNQQQAIETAHLLKGLLTVDETSFLRSEET